MPIEAGDSVVVFPVARPHARRSCACNGNVWTAGAIGFTPGMKLSDAIRLAGGPSPTCTWDRCWSAGSAPTRRASSCARRSPTPPVGRSDDLPLQEDDEITVFSRSEFRGERFVVITGAVRKPGRLPYREGMTLRDALLEARRPARGRVPRVGRGGAAAEGPLGRPGRHLAARAARLDVRLRSRARRHLPRSAGPAGPGRRRPRVRPRAVRQRPDLRAAAAGSCSDSWSITGQVNFPGNYALASRTERLSDLIARAGGLTVGGLPDGRRVLPQPEGQRGPHRHRPAAGARGSARTTTT